MYNELAAALIRKGLITQDTELTGLAQTAATFTGTSAKIKNYVRVQGYNVTSEQITFNCTDVHGRGSYVMDTNDVFEIEGMKPARFAECYNLTVTGDFKKPGKKRGRKPKRKSK